MASEFYDVGKGRGRAEIDSTNRTQAHSRILANKEDAVVLDHDTNQVEVWVSGNLVDKFADGTKIPGNVLRDHKKQSNQ